MKKQLWSRAAALGFTMAMVFGMTGSAWAEETVNVNLERTTGGAVIASYMDGESEIFIPIGESCAVPKGKQVKVWTSSSGFRHQNGRAQRTYLNVNGENVSDERGLNSYTFTAEQDTSVTAGFTTVANQGGEKTNEYMMELGYWTDAASSDEAEFFKYQTDLGSMNQRLALYVNGTKVDFAQASASITEVYGIGIGGNDREYQPGQFNLSADGVLTSKEALNYGSYDFNISVSYGGVKEDLYLSYTVGISGECSFPIYEVSYNGHSVYGMGTVITYNLNSGSTIGELVNAYNSSYHKKIAGYEIVGWKNTYTGAALADTTPIASIMEDGGYVNICPVFQSKADGHIYQVVLQ